ncbi:hypothetical protein NLJ89_g2527 [Agrocybe chaxingu]|uniref:Uncharacterized protein n=1 Tax=Agrocybe chaxingu TaxID=84603 RepID=A0A9W8KC66_9AGAR|nr:hypothetical protein NLJ89_g2527 [Agrocybe chaxingu]
MHVIKFDRLAGSMPPSLFNPVPIKKLTHLFICEHRHHRTARSSPVIDIGDPNEDMLDALRIPSSLCKFELKFVLDLGSEGSPSTQPLLKSFETPENNQWSRLNAFSQRLTSLTSNKWA